MLTLHSFLIKKQIKDVLKLYKYANCNKRASNFSKNYLLFVPRSAGVHTSGSLKARIFKDTENVYAYNILQSLPVYPRDLCLYVDAPETVATQSDFNKMLDQNWQSKSAAEITDCFKRVLNYCVENNIAISDNRFDQLVDGLMDRVQDLTDTNLSDLLTCLTKLPVCDSYTSHNFHDLWSALDDVCCWRATNWSTEMSFLFAEHWYRLNLGKICKYTTTFVEITTAKAACLTKPAVVHLFFFINLCRKRYVDFKFESATEKHVGAMSADEMAIVAMGFFKTQTPIRVKLMLCTMMDRLKAEAATAHEITIAALLKVLRYSSHALLIDQLIDLLDHLVPEIDRLSNICCIHAALLGTTLQFFHPKSLQAISQKIVEQITDVNAVRLKDIERLLLALTMFDFEPNTTPNFFESVYEEIHKDGRRVEFAMHRRCLPSILNFLSLRNVYADDLTSEILDKEHILETYGKHSKKLSRDVFSLDVCVEVERPGYAGNRLDQGFRRKVAKWNVEYTPTWDQYKKLTLADRFILDVVETVTKIVGGKRNLITDHVLPNYVKSDIIICKDLNGCFRQPSGFDEYVLGDVMRPTCSDLRWFSIVTVNWNACIKNTSKPLGLVHMKTRQLRTIGYTPILVIWNEFLPLNEKERIAYINNKIS